MHIGGHAPSTRRSAASRVAGSSEGEFHDGLHRRMVPRQVRQARRRDQRIADREGGDRGHRPCRHRAQGCRRHLCRQHERRLRAPGIPFLAGAADPSRPALQALDPGRECLRHRLGRHPHGAEHARRRQGALRAGGRRREDDRAQQRPGGRGADQGVLRGRGGQHRGGLRRHLRQDHLGLFPALRRQVRRAGQDRGQGAQERRQEPLCAFPEGVRLRVLPQRPRTRTRSWPDRSSAPTARR